MWLIRFGLIHVAHCICPERVFRILGDKCRFGQKAEDKTNGSTSMLGKLSDSLILKEIQPSGLFGGKKTGESVPLPFNVAIHTQGDRRMNRLHKLQEYDSISST